MIRIAVVVCASARLAAAGPISSEASLGLGLANTRTLTGTASAEGLGLYVELAGGVRVNTIALTAFVGSSKFDAVTIDGRGYEATLTGNTANFGARTTAYVGHAFVGFGIGAQYTRSLLYSTARIDAMPTPISATYALYELRFGFDIGRRGPITPQAVMTIAAAKLPDGRGGEQATFVVGARF
jgi:hypothetical protein